MWIVCLIWRWRGVEGRLERKARRFSSAPSRTRTHPPPPMTVADIAHPLSTIFSASSALPLRILSNQSCTRRIPSQVHRSNFVSSSKSWRCWVSSRQAQRRGSTQPRRGKRGGKPSSSPWPHASAGQTVNVTVNCRCRGPDRVSSKECNRGGRGERARTFNLPIESPRATRLSYSSDVPRGCVLRQRSLSKLSGQYVPAVTYVVYECMLFTRPEWSSIYAYVVCVPSPESAGLCFIRIQLVMIRMCMSSGASVTVGRCRTG